MLAFELTPADITAIVGALVAVVTAITTLLKVLGIGSDVKDVHTLVNANLTASTARNDQLVATLNAAGIIVPLPSVALQPPKEVTITVPNPVK